MRRKKTQIKDTQLQEFGIDPFEWVISNESENTFELTHIEDHEMRLNVFLDATSSTSDIETMEWVI